MFLFRFNEGIRKLEMYKKDATSKMNHGAENMKHLKVLKKKEMQFNKNPFRQFASLKYSY